MLENAADSHLSGAPTKMGIIILYERNKGAVGKVYSEAASTQAEQSSGERLVRLPWCTMVFGQIDLDTGGERATTMRKLIPQVTELAKFTKEE